MVSSSVPSSATVFLIAADTGVTAAVLVVVAVVAVALLALFIAAVVSIVGSDRLSESGKAVWVVACLVLQLFGPVAWFVWGRHQNFSV